MKFLNLDELTFERAENGFLRLKMRDGTTYEMVECTPLFPLSKPYRYISVSSRTGNGPEEIGILVDLNALTKEQKALVKAEIEFRYFSPEIIDIKKITSKYGVDQWEVVTDKGEKTFFVQDVKENVIIKDNGLIVIIDIAKCRYQVRDYRRLPTKARVELERRLL